MEPPLGARVAVIDDKDDAAGATELLLEDAGYIPIRVPLSGEVEALVDYIVAHGHAAVCDHRLDRAPRYDGAQVAALVHQRGLPSVLLTTYGNVDVSSSIRKWRKDIPVVMHRGRGDSPDRLRVALHQSARELVGDYSEDRQAHRTVVRVQEVEEPDLALVIVSAWNPHEVVQVPASIITEATQVPAHMLPGRRLLADVNIGATTADDLYFRDIQVAPDVPAEWMPTRAEL